MTTSRVVNQYDENLHHMAEPSAPRDRERAVSVGLDMQQAAAFDGMLREWASQPKITAERSNIAMGYSTWIRRQFQRGNFYVMLYVHTNLAQQVIDDVLYDMWDGVDSKGELLRDIEDKVAQSWGRHNHDADVYDDEGADHRPDPAPSDLEGVPQ